MPATITIELKALRLFGQHGWHDEEALLGNEFEITLLATMPAAENISTLSETVDYTEVYALVKTIFAEREMLLETVAQKIAAALVSEYPEINRLQLTITKLNPLIPAFSGTVGITYTQVF
jgi:dihydroneopterin aldolase